MNTVRLCFAATVAYLVLVIDWSVADAVVCCNSSSVTSGGGVAFCQNENRTFHTVEVIGGGTCDDNRTALPVRKCCPPDQPYDPEVRFCGPAGADDDEYLRRMMRRLRDGSRVVADAVMVGYDYEQPKCDAKQVLVDVPAVEVRGLMEADPSAIELPSDYCFDMTPTDELVARTCRLRDQYCGRDGYTCVNKCCKCDQMYVIDDDGRKCKQSGKPFTMSAYETDANGRPEGLSNSTVIPYYLQLKCSNRDKVDDGFMLTTDGSLYLNGDGQRVPETGYCVEYYAEADAQVVAELQAFVCGKATRDTLVYKFIRASDVASAVCLVLTLLMYNTLPSLQNSRNYYVKFYIACELVSSIMYASQWITEDLKGHTCVLYGYFTLFAVLTSICWLNVICFDIYWMLRYNISINKNKSTSVRTIMYHIYCWGFSSIFVSTGYLFQHSQHETLQKLAPDIGGPFCWFRDTYRYGFYIFYMLPICVIMTANLILFLLTAIHYSRIKSELNTFNPTDSKTESFLVYKDRFVIGIKLFLVMGLPSIISLIGIMFRIHGIVYDFLKTIPRLQGVYIFIIFVAKRKVIMDLRKKFRGSMNHSESIPINTISESS